MSRSISHSIHRDVGRDPAAREAIAGEALTFLAAEPERLRRFLDITGLSPSTLRRAAAAPDFAASLLDYIAGDEWLLVAFAADSNRDPATVERLRASLGTPPLADD